jgi:hypothetical protein
LVKLFLAIKDENIKVLIQYLDPFTVLVKVAKMLVCSIIACRSRAFFSKVFAEVDVALTKSLPTLESWVGVYSLTVAKTVILLVQLLHGLFDFLWSKLTVEHDGP